MRVAFGLALVGAGIVVGVATTLAVLRSPAPGRPSSAASRPEIIPAMPKPPLPARVAGKGTLSKLLSTDELPSAFEALESLDKILRRSLEPPEYTTRPDRAGLDKFLADDDVRQVAEILKDEDRRLQKVLEEFMTLQAPAGAEPLPDDAWFALRVLIGLESIGAGVSALADLPPEEAAAVREGRRSIGQALGNDAPLAVLAESLHRLRNETYSRVEAVIPTAKAARFRKWLPEGIFTGYRCALDLGKAPTPLRR